MSTVELAGGLSRQFLLWVADRPRTYTETMEAWRTTCPRLSAWEDAIADNLIWIDAQDAVSHGQAAVRLTERGAAALHGAGSFGVDRPEPACGADGPHQAPADRRDGPT